MRTEVFDRTLVLHLEGCLDAGNAEAVQKEMEEAILRNPSENLQLDATNLTYISSMGLRVLLAISKARKEKISIVNVNPEVMDIFQTTGFTELFLIRKPMREVSIEGLEEIGSGMSAQVYRLDAERIIKVYRPFPSNTLAFIERERNVSREIFLHGVPTAIPYEVVRVGERIGVIYEMLNATVLSEYVPAHPEELDAIIARQAALLKSIHSIHFSHSILSSIKHRIVTGVRASLSDLFSADELDAYERAIAQIPDTDTMVHGDYNLRNIMIDQKGELTLIDIGSAGIGHPVFDLVTMMPLSRSLKGIMSRRELFFANPNATEEAFQKTQKNEAVHYDIWRRFLSAYFDERDEKKLDHIEDAILVYAYGSFLYIFSGLLNGQWNALRNGLLRGLYDHFMARRDEIGGLSEWWKV